MAVEDPVACWAERLVMELAAEGLAMESAAGMARPYPRVLMAMSAVEPVACRKDESVRAAWVATTEAAEAVVAAAVAAEEVAAEEVAAEATDEEVSRVVEGRGRAATAAQ